MDNGRPFDLLNDPTTILSKFVSKLGKEEIDYFLKIAAGQIDKTAKAPEKINEIVL
jgi:hypothetical protein